MKCESPEMIMIIINAEMGIMPKMRAYGFSGKSPYHFSRMYFNPCAIKIESGRTKRRDASGLKPEIKIVKTIKYVAIEFLDAKKPLTVEKRPVKARKRIGRPINGVR